MNNLCDTSAFARLNGIKPASVRSRLWQSGSYYGIKPVKHANRRLLWPRVMVTPDKVSALERRGKPLEQSSGSTQL